MAFWRFGEDPLTWCFVKLFGVHICRNLVDYDGIPQSHAWPIIDKTKESIVWKRLITKAQVSGIIVSMEIKSERVEFLLDDGTDLIPCILWRKMDDALSQMSMKLGDLVHFEGKLQWNKMDGARVELRVLRYRLLEDPNEEMYHWLDVMHLCRSSYSSLEYAQSEGERKRERKSIASLALKNSNKWEMAAATAFFQPDTEAEQYTEPIKKAGLPADACMIKVLNRILDKQKEAAPEPAQITFVQIFNDIDHEVTTMSSTNARQERIRLLRRAFADLREIGILYLSDPDQDIHIFQSYPYTLKPAILLCLQGHEGRLYMEIAELVLSQKQFNQLSLDWLEYAVHKLEAEELIVEEQQRYKLRYQGATEIKS